MSSTLAEQIAWSLDAKPQLLPVMPELLADLWELGTSAEEVVSALRSAGVKPGDTALDLGCGKGAVSVALATLGLQVEGVDAFPAFVEAARALAADREVESRCTFREADMREVLGTTAQYDVVLLLSVGPISGDHRTTIEDLRRLVRPGGFIVIDDVFIEDGAMHHPADESYATHADMLNQLTAFGDRLVEEVLYVPEHTRTVNRRNTDLIRQRATRLKARNPALSGLLDEFVATQELETQLLGGEIREAIWVVQHTTKEDGR